MASPRRTGGKQSSFTVHSVRKMSNAHEPRDLVLPLPLSYAEDTRQQQFDRRYNEREQELASARHQAERRAHREDTRGMPPPQQRRSFDESRGSSQVSFQSAQHHKQQQQQQAYQHRMHEAQQGHHDPRRTAHSEGRRTPEKRWTSPYPAQPNGHPDGHVQGRDGQSFLQAPPPSHHAPQNHQQQHQQQHRQHRVPPPVAPSDIPNPREPMNQSRSRSASPINRSPLSENGSALRDNVGANERDRPTKLQKPPPSPSASATQYHDGSRAHTPTDMNPKRDLSQSPSPGFASRFMAGLKAPFSPRIRAGKGGSDLSGDEDDLGDISGGEGDGEGERSSARVNPVQVELDEEDPAKRAEESKKQAQKIIEMEEAKKNMEAFLDTSKPVAAAEGTPWSPRQDVSVSFKGPEPAGPASSNGVQPEQLTPAQRIIKETRQRESVGQIAGAGLQGPRGDLRVVNPSAPSPDLGNQVQERVPEADGKEQQRGKNLSEGVHHRASIASKHPSLSPNSPLNHPYVHIITRSNGEDPQMDVPATLFGIVQRFERLEKWAVPRIRGLEEQIVGKERSAESERVKGLEAEVEMLKKRIEQMEKDAQTNRGVHRPVAAQAVAPAEDVFHSNHLRAPTAASAASVPAQVASRSPTPSHERQQSGAQANEGNSPGPSPRRRYTAALSGPPPSERERSRSKSPSTSLGGFEQEVAAALSVASTIELRSPMPVVPERASTPVTNSLGLPAPPAAQETRSRSSSIGESTNSKAPSPAGSATTTPAAGLRARAQSYLAATSGSPTRSASPVEEIARVTAPPPRSFVPAEAERVTPSPRPSKILANITSASNNAANTGNAVGISPIAKKASFFDGTTPSTPAYASAISAEPDTLAPPVLTSATTLSANVRNRSKSISASDSASSLGVTHRSTVPTSPSSARSGGLSSGNSSALHSKDTSASSLAGAGRTNSGFTPGNAATKRTSQYNLSGAAAAVSNATKPLIPTGKAKGVGQLVKMFDAGV